MKSSPQEMNRGTKCRNQRLSMDFRDKSSFENPKNYSKM